MLVLMCVCVCACVRVCMCMCACVCAFGVGDLYSSVMFNILPITFKTVTITRHDILKRRKKAKNLTTVVGQESKYADIILMNYITK